MVATGMDNIDFTNVISINESAEYLWKHLAPRKHFTVDDMAELLTREYEVDLAQATADCRELVQKWTNIGLLEGDDLPPVSKEVEEMDLSQAKEKAPEAQSRKGFWGKLFKG